MSRQKAVGRMKNRRSAPATIPPIVFEDADVLIVHKPPGLLTSTGPREKRKTLLAMVEEYVGSRESRARVGLIHRLDRDASGLLVFSKHHEAYRSLKDQFFNHSVDRVYTALVHGKPNPEKGRIETRLIERADGTVYSNRKPAGGEHAVSEYETLKSKNRMSLVKVRLETGRKHQIRVHLSEQGVPIVGDRMYGTKQPGRTNQLMLIATELAFDHPRTGERVKFRIPIPRRMRAMEVIQS
jgi:23S rRNA pseudouridine1911/1915/1917 synthase